jgi:membrane dipeptidase
MHPEKGLYARRDFEPGEAWADHQRQLDGIRTASATAGFEVLLSCEGGDFLEDDAGRLEEVVNQGVSSLTLVHYRVNELGDVQTEPAVHGGLTAFGREVVAECNRLGVLIDCAHASVDTTMDVLETSRHPVMISHGHLHGPGRSHPRLLSQRHALAVAGAGGLIGAWPSGVVCRSVADFGDEVLRLVDVVGVEHVGIGTDLDGNYRPVVTEYAQFAEVRAYLGARGLSDDELDKVFGRNAMALLDAVRNF